MLKRADRCQQKLLVISNIPNATGLERAIKAAFQQKP